MCAVPRRWQKAGNMLLGICPLPPVLHSRQDATHDADVRTVSKPPRDVVCVKCEGVIRPAVDDSESGTWT